MNIQQQQQNQKNGDFINNLPTDKNPLSTNEINIVNQIFKKQKTVIEKILSETKDVLGVGLLFLVFCVPQIDNLIKKIITSANNSIYILICVKTCLFMIAYFVIKNIYLARKNN